MIDPPLILLHISDAHFGSMSHWDDLDPREAARKYLNETGAVLKSYGLLRENAGFDAVVLSGDYTWGPDSYKADDAHRRGFEVMRHFLDMVVNEAKWIPDAKHVIIVPGNHDVMWGAFDPDSKCRRFLLRGEAEQRYRKMLGEIFNDPMRQHPHLSYCASVKKGTRTFVILGLNSTRIERLETAGIGYVGHDQLEDLATRALDSIMEPTTLVAVLHHHLEANPEGPNAPPKSLDELAYFAGTPPTLVVESHKLLTTLTGAGTLITLHGHRHKRWEWPYNTPGPNLMEIYGAGSIGLCKESGQIQNPHQFQVLEIRSDQVQCHSLYAELEPRETKRIWKYELRPVFRRQGTISQKLNKLINDNLAKKARINIRLFESCVLYDYILRGDSGATEILKNGVRVLYERRTPLNPSNDFDSLFDAALGQLLSEYPAERAQELRQRIFEEEMDLPIQVWRRYIRKL